jgi:hypothetical protein
MASGGGRPARRRAASAAKAPAAPGPVPATAERSATATCPRRQQRQAQERGGVAPIRKDGDVRMGAVLMGDREGGVQGASARASGVSGS